MDENKEQCMYIFVNMDLQMGKGKIAGQVGHVVGQIVNDILLKQYQMNIENKCSGKTIECYLRYIEWIESSHKKVILKATTEQLKKLSEEPEAISIRDEGRTQIAPNSLTVVGFYPNTNLKNKFKDYKLL